MRASGLTRSVTPLILNRGNRSVEWKPTWCSVDCLSVGRPVCRANRQTTKKHNTYQLYIYSMPPDDGLQTCPKYVEVDWRNKLRINCAPSWFSLHGCIEMLHGQQNIKLGNRLGWAVSFIHPSLYSQEINQVATGCDPEPVWTVWETRS